MNVAIFAAMTGRQAGGPESYELELIKALSLAAGNAYSIYCVNPEARKVFRNISPALSVHTLWPRFRWISFTTTLPLSLWLRRPDVFHATYVAPPVFPGRMVLTLHDLSPFSNPEFYPAAIRLRLQRGFARSIRLASAICCVSRFTRDHLAELFPSEVEKAVVTPHGVNPIFHRLENREPVHALLDRIGVRDPYVLCLGKLQARKNTARVIEAFHLWKSESNLPHKIVMVGRKMWTSSEIHPLVKRLGLEKEIVFTGHLPDADIPLLYNGASALVFPSLFEGFGMPVLEAMACGCPVVTSSVTSLPEVAGDCAVVVDPHRVEEIAAGIRRVLTDESLREDMIRRGYERARQFTWETTARLVAATYQQVAAVPRVAAS
jgi:glycosyltransferase involved in cell wall biosynthesis